jgi:L-ascorbate metabolism protein UlaG (beta-lactamase superfamily)
MRDPASQTSFANARVRRWSAYLWREAIRETWRPVAPAAAKPRPGEWDDRKVTMAWLGHATVLINFFGVKIITDPALFSRVGIRFAGLTLGPKRLIAPALRVRELPEIDLVLLSHAHFDHFDRRTLRRLDRAAHVVTAPRTSDLLRGTGLRHITELRWGESEIADKGGGVMITAFRVQHWGARMQHDNQRGYNGYLIERGGRRIIFGGDTAMTDTFGELRSHGRIDVALMSIGCYNPWIRTHCTPEEALAMADAAGAEYILPIHHQTFRLSFEPPREPIERLEAALLHRAPERIALREIGETFVLPT